MWVSVDSNDRTIRPLTFSLALFSSSSETGSWTTLFSSSAITLIASATLSGRVPT